MASVCYVDDQDIYNFTVHIDHHGYEPVCLAAILPAALPTCALPGRDLAIYAVRVTSQSLDRMQSRGLIESFELPLRRRGAEGNDINAPETGNTRNG